VWDAGYGFDKGVARASGWFTFIAALLLTGIYWLVVMA
jgi:succinate dehydrogenase/fumarate reductase cytochrome b subunit